MNDLDRKIFVAGHRGMVGSAIVRGLLSRGIGDSQILRRSRSDLDLTNQREVQGFLQKHKPDELYIAAAKVGGIYANNTYPAEFIYQNLMIEANLIHSAFESGVSKLIFLGSSCIYPRDAQQPMNEQSLLTGVLEPTNEPYAIAKIAGIKLCESYNRQYSATHDLDYRSVMPTNLYGPGDNYHLENSHVIPALMRRFHLVQSAVEGNINTIELDEEKYGAIPAEFKQYLFEVINGAKPPQVSVWGTGNARREFLHVDDMAEACIYVMELPKHEYSKNVDEMNSHINIGCGHDMTIKDLVEEIIVATGYSGEVVYDISKPDGAPRKLMDTKRLFDLGWEPSVEFGKGIKDTYKRYKSMLV